MQNPTIRIYSNSSYEWEMTLLKGALAHAGVNFQMDTAIQEPLHKDTLYVYFPALELTRTLRDFFSAAKKPLIIAGHSATLKYLGGIFTPRGNEVLVYGEPYAALAAFGLNRHSISCHLGTAIAGPLLDLANYNAISGTGDAGSVLVPVSRGCSQACGYCTIGKTYTALYGPGYRRLRSHRSIEDDLSAGLRAGYKNFKLLADRLFDTDCRNNRFLADLSVGWAAKKKPRIHLNFSISPLEVLENIDILIKMDNAFKIRPTLMIDSFDMSFLRKLRLPHDPDSCLEAVSALMHLEISFRVGYIFPAYETTLRSLEEELSYIEEAARLMGRGSYRDNKVSAIDFFSNPLKFHPYMPLSEGKESGSNYMSDFPIPLLKVIMGIQQALWRIVEDSNLPAHVAGRNPVLWIVEQARKAIAVYGDS